MLVIGLGKLRRKMALENDLGKRYWKTVFLKTALENSIGKWLWKIVL
jgi:hypothetical protein